MITSFRTAAEWTTLDLDSDASFSQLCTKLQPILYFFLIMLCAQMKTEEISFSQGDALLYEKCLSLCWRPGPHVHNWISKPSLLWCNSLKVHRTHTFPQSLRLRLFCHVNNLMTLMERLRHRQEPLAGQRASLLLFLSTWRPRGQSRILVVLWTPVTPPAACRRSSSPDSPPPCPQPLRLCQLIDHYSWPCTSQFVCVCLCVCVCVCTLKLDTQVFGYSGGELWDG